MTIARLTAAASVLALASALASAAHAEDFPLAPLENFGKVAVTARQSAGAIAFEQAFGGAFDAEPASDYPESSELRRLGRAVGRLDVAFSRGVGYCTAFLISDRYLMTNAHCLEGGQVQSINFIAGYVESGIEDGTRTYNVGTTPVEISPSSDLDFAILQVFGNPAAEWGTLELAAREIDETRDAGMPLMVLGHPVFQVAPVPVPQALYVSRKECRATDSKPLAGKQMRHTCDTLNGNSGSPVFSDDSRQVIALHHAGSPREGINFAIPMTLIAQKSKVVAELLALAPAPDQGNAALAAQLAAAQAELDRLRQQSAAAEAERRRLAEEAEEKAEAERLAREAAEAAEAERRRLAEDAARKAVKKAQAERLARAEAEAERQRLAEQLAALKAAQDRAKAAVEAKPAVAARELSDDALAPKAEPAKVAVVAIPDSTPFPASYWEKTIQTLIGHERDVLSAAFSLDGTRIVTSSDDSTARVWDVATGRSVATFSGHEMTVTSAAFSPDGTQVITTSSNAARVWDVATGRPMVMFPGQNIIVWSAQFSPDGMRIVTASSDKTARVWDALTGRNLVTLSGHSASVSSAAFSPDGTRIVTASLDRTARVWDIATGRTVMTLSGHLGGVLDAAFSPDGTKIVTSSRDKTAWLWDAENGQRLAALSGHLGTVANAAFSPDGKRIITASYDGTAWVWDATTIRTLARLSPNPNVGFSKSLFRAAFSPDGTHIVTASADKTARIWGGY